MKDNEQTVPDTKALPKKAYQQPELHVYGTLRNITKTVGNMGVADGGSPPMHKTHA